MKTRRITFVLAAALAFLGVQTVKADGGNTSTQGAEDKVTLNIILKPIQTLVVNPTQKTVDIVYENPEDYSEGVTVEKEEHLTLYSTGGFAVQVKSSTDLLEANSQSIDASSIMIAATAADIADYEQNYVELSTTAQELMSSTSGVVNGKVDVLYSGKGSNAYLNKQQGYTQTVFTTEVTYTIIAQ